MELPLRFANSTSAAPTGWPGGGAGELPRGRERVDYGTRGPPPDRPCHNYPCSMSHGARHDLIPRTGMVCDWAAGGLP